MPILGGWLADSKFGKYSVIFFSGIIYFIGTILLPLGSITYDKKEMSQWAANEVTTNTHFIQGVYITGLFLIALGTGGVKANVSPLGAEQVSHLGPHAVKSTSSIVTGYELQHNIKFMIICSTNIITIVITITYTLIISTTQGHHQIRDDISLPLPYVPTPSLSP